MPSDLETPLPVDRILNLIERIRTESREHPDAVAIESLPYRVTYAELTQQADIVTAIVRRSGCRPGEVIVVLITDGAALITAMLGVLQAGGIFVPLNDEGPAEALRQTLSWLKPKLLLTTEANYVSVKRLATSLGGFTSVQSIANAVDEVSESPLSAMPFTEMFASSSDAASYVYFTSGSTGQPKAIAGNLNSLAQRIAWEIDAFNISRGFRVTQLIAPTFDPWFRDIFVPLCAGGTICIPPARPGRLTAETLLEWLRDSKVNLMHCGPTLLNALVSTAPKIRRLPDLRLILLSGEFLHVSLVSRWRRRFGATRLVNLYGATEATMIQFYHVVEASDLERDFIPIGRPLPGVEVLLINEDGKPGGLGKVGEILVGGSDLSLGYFRDQEATRKVFVEIDLPDGKRTQFYHTCDLGMKCDDGTYRLIGRCDDQVKIRGVRVEPRQVEDMLTGYPSIAACAVTVRQESESEPVLVAYVVPETEHRPAIPEMRAYLRDRLPMESIPAKFVFIKQLPLTETGKVDRQRLPEANPTAYDANHTGVAPRNILERVLAQYWCDILGLAQVDVHDHFMDLGGHSLSAMRLLARLSADHNFELSVEDILDNPTIAALAQRILTLTVSKSKTQTLTKGSAAASASPTPKPHRVLDDVTKSNAAEAKVACPHNPSPLFGARRCNLVLFPGDDGDRESFETVMAFVREFDPAIHTVIVEDKPGGLMELPRQPTLFFSPAMIRNRPRIPGRVVCGYPLSKSEEYSILAEAGISVPRWVRLQENALPNLEGFGAYVVRKPDYGANGAEVRIVKRGRIRWKRVVTSAAGPSPTLLVQQFIYTGLWPVSYRINTLFGRVLYCLRITGNRSRPILRGPSDFAARKPGTCASIVATARDSTAEFCDDINIMSLAERAARTFSDIPMLGVDVLKEVSSGQLYVTEVNALGHNWNFGREFRDRIGVDVAEQFNGLRKAAYILAEETQKLAQSG